MKAAVLESVGRLMITDVPLPTLGGPDEALVRVRAVGICGSEIHAFKGTHPFRKPPSVLGHEVTGDIVRLGQEVQGFEVGDRAFVDPQWTCGTCVWCTSGRHNLCPTKRVLGTPQWSGALGETIVAPAQALYPLPDGLSYVEGTTVEPLSVGVHMVERACVRAGESVVVLGTGPIGMMVVAVASVRGAAPIVAVDLKQHCLDAAQAQLGATHGLLANGGSVADRILDITQGRGIDAVFLTVGVPALVEQAIQVAGCEGRIFFVALFDRPVQLAPNALIDKHLTLLASAMYNAREIRTALDMVASGQVRAGAMVTHVLPLEEAQRAFDLAASKEEGAIKVVIEMGKGY